MTEKTTTIEIGGYTYVIERFNALDGSWVLMQILTKTLPQMLESLLGKMNGAGQLAPNRASLSEDEFRSLQAHALSVCRRIEKGMPMPVFVKPNRWGCKDLEDDLLAVMTLTAQSLVFNLTPFFQGGGLKQILSLLPLKLLVGLPQTSSASPSQP